MHVIAWERLSLPQIVALTDTNAEWSKSLGLSIDLSAKGLGVRTTRYALVLEDLVVKHIQVHFCPVSCPSLIASRSRAMPARSMRAVLNVCWLSCSYVVDPCAMP